MNFRDYPEEDLRALSQRAGVASGKARREKRKKIEQEKIRIKAIQEQDKDNWQTIERTMAICHKCAKRFARKQKIQKH